MKTVAKIQDMQVAKLWSNDHVYIIGICQFRKNMANCDRWPTYKSGQLHRFYCISTLVHQIMLTKETI
jgi:hypothetical protein